METLLFPLLILLLFIPIFLSGRKQRRQMQEMQQLQAALEPGDVVVTTSGLRATVVDASYEETVDLEIADGVVTTWVRAAVREKVNPTPDDVSSLTDGSADVADEHDAEPVERVEDKPAVTDSTPEPTGTTDDARSNGTPGSRN
ncbi:preprotein translocase subunit YajC [Pseudonocardia acidicola]|uniref:Preprotein translocase subunit YajC n=1 Tax=Pseudonocardia acidicola TaxID=2724939 RepID=A0ABX1SI61_9PSEU|nr:preprotein translocase subunit YajC [Pseudonocardia acidicola]NMI01241.1 preprotein translocase subunit YajC [Pseudonocardia acidicola]